MKKIVSLLLALLMLMGMMAIPTMAASDDVKVYLDGEKLEFDVPAQIVNGRTMVPVRKIFESLGYTVEWDGNTRTATATSTERTVLITIDEPVMYVNGEAKALDVPACIIDGRTLVPLRAISEASGYKVDWGEATRSAFIITPIENIGPYDELRDIIKEKGFAVEQFGVYAVEYMVEDKTVYFMYRPEDEDISMFIYDDSDGHEWQIGVNLRKDEVNLVSFMFDFGRDNWKELLGRYNNPGEPYEIFSTNLSGEDLESVKGLISETLAYYIDPALYHLSGFSLEDFGIVY